MPIADSFLRGRVRAARQPLARGFQARGCADPLPGRLLGLTELGLKGEAVHPGPVEDLSDLEGEGSEGGALEFMRAAHVEGGHHPALAQLPHVDIVHSQHSWKYAHFLH